MPDKPMTAATRAEAISGPCKVNFQGRLDCACSSCRIWRDSWEQLDEAEKSAREAAREEDVDKRQAVSDECERQHLSAFARALGLEDATRECDSYHAKVMVGLYGAESICALPMGHLGDCDSVFSVAEHQPCCHGTGRIPLTLAEIIALDLESWADAFGVEPWKHTCDYEHPPGHEFCLKCKKTPRTKAEIVAAGQAKERERCRELILRLPEVVGSWRTSQAIRALGPRVEEPADAES